MPVIELERELIERSSKMYLGFYQRKQLSPSVSGKMNHRNFYLDIDRQWRYEHLQEYGYLGFNYRFEEGEPVFSISEVVRMWGLVKFLRCTYMHWSGGDIM
jgi:hypothetical protein